MCTVIRERAMYSESSYNIQQAMEKENTIQAKQDIVHTKSKKHTF